MEQIDSSLDDSKIASVADYLLKNEEVILKEWKDRLNIKSEQPSSLASLSRNEFYNSLPQFIENICKVLRNEDTWLEEIARTHGSQRWEYGFDLRMVTEEWGKLFMILMKQVNKYQETYSLPLETFKAIQERLAKFVHQAIKNSVDEYFKLQRKKAETQIDDMEAIIRESDGLNMQRGRNLQQASHDVGGSMVVVKMNLALLKELELSEEASEIVEQLSLAANNLSDLLNNLLDLFRLEAGREKLEIEEFDVAELLQELASNMKSLAEAKGLDIRINGSESFKVQGDPLKVKRIAQNLLLNSLKYTEEGYIDISWKREPDNHWLMHIEDTGPGIDPTNVSLFTDANKGTKADQASDTSTDHGPEEVKMHSEGIGLLIIRQLCQLLDAVVKVDVEREKGTSFKVIFPTEYSK